MKKLKSICLSIIICLSFLACGRIINLSGLNLASAKEATIGQTPSSTTHNIKLSPRNNISGLADSVQVEDDVTDGDTDEDATSGDAIETHRHHKRPAYGFELHAKGKIWILHGDHDHELDPEFSFDGDDEYGIMLIDENDNQEIERTHKKHHHHHHGHKLQTEVKELVEDKMREEENNTNPQTTNVTPDVANSQNPTDRSVSEPKTDIPSTYPAKPIMPRTIQPQTGNTLVTPDVQKPNEAKVGQDNNSTTDNTKTTPRTNNIVNSLKDRLIPNHQNTAPEGPKATASLGAVKFCATTIPNAVFVKKIITRQANVSQDKQTATPNQQNKQEPGEQQDVHQRPQKTSLPLGDNNILTNDNQNIKSTDTANSSTDSSQPVIAIVIDDFGGWERGGVDTLLNSDVPITCAIIPFADNSEIDYQGAIQNNKEVILHMPMEAHVNLPQEWYGTIYIANTDTPETAIEKLEKCLASMPEAKGFNFHIGSGVNRNLTLMRTLYHYAKTHNMFFLDSRTILNGVGQEACDQEDCTYLGRDVFLEPEKNRSYQGVYNRLEEGMQVATQNGAAVVIGHVGAEGGENTAKCISDHAQELAQKYGVKIVPLSKLYSKISEKN